MKKKILYLKRPGKSTPPLKEVLEVTKQYKMK